ncbi:MAG TPA: exodeoxyribonuclease VII large subunit [Candidatus Limnocylindrales bacterium]|nr:exodeoxyribonuclease VII large subunit [Candidatus Limnocylindrales bacterium]
MSDRPVDPERPWERWLEEPPHPAESHGAAAGIGSGPAPATSRGSDAPPGPRIRPVGELTRLLRDLLRGDPRLRDLWVEGEVGQVSISAAGHCYFTLKDERAQLRCVIFRDERRVVRFEPRTGLRVVAHGRIDLFEPQGAYQLYVDALQPAGFGDLALRFEALKAALAAEGLFDPARKRPLPSWPGAIGLATSISGAALHDIRQVLARRWPLVRVFLAPCQVQGDGAPESIVAALRRLGGFRDAARGGRALDLVILARGGGSLEDLWPFNDERVVHAVAASPLPVVVGVGHETDVTLAEFAADVRAATPSVAAELAVPARAEQAAGVALLGRRLGAAAGRVLSDGRRTLEAERRALESARPEAILAAERERVGLLLDRAARAVGARLATDAARIARAGDRLPLLASSRAARARAELRAVRAGLATLSPYATLERGYAIVRTPEGAIVREAGERRAGDPLEVRLARGGLDVRVERVRDSGP